MAIYIFMLSTYLLISAVDSLDTSSSVTKDDHTKTVSVETVDLNRLRQMFKESQDLALEGLYEAKALEALKNGPADSNYKLLDDIDSDPTDKVELKDHSHSDARQSSFFNSFRPPPFPAAGYNPLMNNLFTAPAQLPKIPTFAFATPRPPKPPKSSIIGNNGGNTALTNDNVVVVNVLSNNY